VASSSLTLHMDRHPSRTALQPNNQVKPINQPTSQSFLLRPKAAET